jgi:hypothetical protein
VFDLRFVPDDTKFESGMLKEKCEEIPVSGEVKNFVNRALGHSKVELTWEDPQLNTIAVLKNKNWGKMSEKEMESIDWGMYINEEMQEANDQLDKMLRKKEGANSGEAQLSDWRKECNKGNRRNNSEEELEIAFPSGFDKPRQK